MIKININKPDYFIDHANDIQQFLEDLYDLIETHEFSSSSPFTAPVWLRAFVRNIFFEVHTRSERLHNAIYLNDPYFQQFILVSLKIYHDRITEYLETKGSGSESGEFLLPISSGGRKILNQIESEIWDDLRRKRQEKFSYNQINPDHYFLDWLISSPTRHLYFESPSEDSYLRKANEDLFVKYMTDEEENRFVLDQVRRGMALEAETVFDEVTNRLPGQHLGYRLRMQVLNPSSPKKTKVEETLKKLDDLGNLVFLKDEHTWIRGDFLAPYIDNEDMKFYLGDEDYVCLGEGFECELNENICWDLSIKQNRKNKEITSGVCELDQSSSLQQRSTIEVYQQLKKAISYATERITQ